MTAIPGIDTCQVCYHKATPDISDWIKNKHKSPHHVPEISHDPYGRVRRAREGRWPGPHSWDDWP